jgi:4a-hydroxytetrahydrobiopterin dehydratase
MSNGKNTLGDLAEQKRVPCKGGEPKATPAEIGTLRAQVLDWELIEVEGIQRLRRRYTFSDFASAMRFAQQVGVAAESQDHHPRTTFEWGRRPALHRKQPPAPACETALKAHLPESPLDPFCAIE